MIIFITIFKFVKWPFHLQHQFVHSINDHLQKSNNLLPQLLELVSEQLFEIPVKCMPSTKVSESGMHHLNKHHGKNCTQMK